MSDGCKTENESEGKTESQGQSKGQVIVRRARSTS